ncbi:SDR family oxidoreductase [Roseomonas stagni]|uniref:SDR family oxidoreductase n=1 Tax=Falsiroseomonas algicola TaxID=2716930 RepID=A0A6M1LJW0_9PROT|nr:SDR family oxidoreductase [Falsiroseomonas algicola]
MTILVIGGHGLVGGAVVAALLAEGHAVAGAGRGVARAAYRQPAVRWHRIDMADPGADWMPVLAGVTAVVNCAGALQDGPADSLAGVHVAGLARLVAGCEAAGVRRFIQVSAAGVGESPGAFGATKREGDACLARSGLDWLVLRPGLVLAPVAYGGSALLRALAAFPLVVPALHPGQVVQVVGADDVAAAVLASLRPGAPRGVAIDLVSLEPTTLADILTRLRGWLGLAPAPVVAVPRFVAAVGAGLADGVAWLGWRSPMRSTAIAQLAAGVPGDGAAAVALLGRPVRGLSAWLAAHPAGVQEAWFARLYLMKPAVIGMLSLFWLVSGLVGLARPAEAASVLTAAGFTQGMALAAVLGGSLADIALGLMAAHRRTARLALWGMVAVTAAYLAGATLWRPDLWLDPLGVLVKTLPAAMLALVGLALLEDR